MGDGIQTPAAVPCREGAPSVEEVYYPASIHVIESKEFNFFYFSLDVLFINDYSLQDPGDGSFKE